MCNNRQEIEAREKGEREERDAEKESWGTGREQKEGER